MGCDSIYDDYPTWSIGNTPTREERRIVRLEDQVRALQAEIATLRKGKRA